MGAGRFRPSLSRQRRTNCEQDSLRQENNLAIRRVGTKGKVYANSTLGHGSFDAARLTGKMMVGKGRDLLMDTIMGVAGAVAGGCILSAEGIPVQRKMIYRNLT